MSHRSITYILEAAVDARLIGQLRTEFPLLLSFPYGGLSVFRGLKSMRAGRYLIVHELFALLDDHQRRTHKPVQLQLVFEQDGVLRYSAIIPGMEETEVKLLQLLTESWSEEICEICGNLGFIDVMSEQRRCRCVSHQSCTADQLHRDELALVVSLIGYKRTGMPVTLFCHVAEIRPARKSHRLNLTVFALPDKVDSIREKPLLTHCTSVHYPDLFKDQLPNVLDSLKNSGITPVVLIGHSFLA